MAKATCAAAELKGKSAPDWVHLLPAGEVKGRDGRNWRLDRATEVIRNSQTGGTDLPIDYDHEADVPKRVAGPLPAAGWIKTDSLEAREDGIWARVEWTARARELIANREYRYLSPVLNFDGRSKQVTRLLGAGLVHRPNLSLVALASEEFEMTDTADMSEALAKIAAALGLSAGVGLEEILAGIAAKAEPDPAKYVPIEAVADLMRDRNQRAANSSMHLVEAKVDRAIAAGHLPPAMRGWATALCCQDADSFDAFLASSAAPYAHLSKPSANEGRALNNTQRPVSQNDALICAQLGLAPADLK